jgi:hypothetical protein
MADKPLSALPVLDSSELAGNMLVYLSVPIGGGAYDSRATMLSELKTWVNTDPSEPPASEPLRGASVGLSSGVNVSTTAEQIISWTSEAYDTDAMWSAGAPTRLTVPSGVTMVELFAGMRSTAAAAKNINISIRKNGTTYVAAQGFDSGFANFSGAVATGPIAVTPGDYFELTYTQSDSATRTLANDGRTFFRMHAVEHTL